MNREQAKLKRNLERKWDEKMQYEHRERVFSIKKTIDTESPA